MGLLGTLIGGSIGFMLGGPFGAIIGGAIGSNIGEAGNQFRQPHPGSRTGGYDYGSIPRNGRGRYDPLAAQQAFMVAMISLAAKVAKADGRVTPEEVASFDRFLRDSMGMSGEDRRLAARIFNEARDSTIPAEEFARQIRQLLGHQPHRMRDLITLLMTIAMADGQLQPAEERMIRSIAVTLGLSAADYDAATSMFGSRNNLEAAYKTLGVDQRASDADVKRAYRNLAKEYHPDVLANKGMGEDFKQFAAEKMRAVNAAYDQVKEARGL